LTSLYIFRNIFFVHFGVANYAVMHKKSDAKKGGKVITLARENWSVCPAARFHMAGGEKERVGTHGGEGGTPRRPLVARDSPLPK
jgi:hypothetical protein